VGAGLGLTCASALVGAPADANVLCFLLTLLPLACPLYHPCLPTSACLQGDGKPEKGVKALPDGKGFVKDGVEYRWAKG